LGLDKITFVFKHLITKIFFMDFNLPDIPPNNYTQNLNTPLPTQLSLDQLMAQVTNKAPELNAAELLAGLSINNTVLPEPIKIKRQEAEDKDKNED
jgi:hypothetical protein